MTEQDVVNEEMYEEEDDDLPMQYRRLTAHLQTTNVDFDRRLAAYLTNHVAMRTALGQAVSNTWDHQAQQQQQYSNAPQFANTMQQYSQGPFPNPMLPPQMLNRSPQSYRQSPYPVQSPHMFHANVQHNRSASVASPHELHGYSSYPQHSPVEPLKQENRRMSLPVQTSQVKHERQITPVTPQSLVSPTQQSPTISRTSSSSNIANLKYEAAQQGFFGSNSKPTSPTGEMTPQQSTPMPQQHPSTTPGGFDPSVFNMPQAFSTALPAESQQLLGPALDPNDPFTSLLMQGHNDQSMHQPFYSYNPNGAMKQQKNFNPYEGMNQTLAPGVLDTSMANPMGAYNTPSSAADSVMTPFTPAGYGMAFDNAFNEPFKPSFNPVDGASNTGDITPSGEWADFIDGNAWEQPSSQPTVAA